MESGGGNPYRTGPDGEPVSYFSDDSSSSGGASPRDASLLIPSPANGNPQAEEDGDVDAKIDRLVAAIERGRSLHFRSDEETGDVDIFAEDNDEADSEDSELEKAIAESPLGFGNIIRRDQRHLIVRSPLSIMLRHSFDSLSSSGSSNACSTSDWESEDIGSGKHSTIERKSISSDTRGRQQSSGSTADDESDDHGQHLLRVSSRGLEYELVTPLPLRWSKKPTALTPSVQSNGTEVDCSSPLFEKSCETELRKLLLQPDKKKNFRQTPRSPPLIPGKLNLQTTVTKWLERIIPPRKAEISESSKPSKKELEVFSDEPVQDAISEHRVHIAPMFKALKDISNLRRPGFLGRNSFAKGKSLSAEINRNAANRADPDIMVGASLDGEFEQSHIAPRQSDLLGRQQARDREALTISEHGVSLEGSLPTFDQPKDSDVERAAHHALALARLEGRDPPPPFTPIKRFADWEDLYSPHTEVEQLRPPLYHPKPLRIIRKVSDAERLAVMSEQARLAGPQMERK